MSISVVSSMPKTTPTSASESVVSSSAGADSSTGGLDFLGLLLTLGQQLEPGIDKISGEEITSGKDDSSASDTSSDTSSDPTNLLATLGFTPVEIKADIAPLSANVAAPTPTINASPSNKVLDALKTPDNESNSDALSFATLASDLVDTSPGKAARIAADALTIAKSETFSSNEAITENTAPSSSTLNAENAFKTTLPAHDAALAVRSPLRTSEWSHDLGQKIVWMATNEKQSAQITLNPEQMGPIEVSLNVDKGNVSASFTSANAEVREAIETALPRLREMFASAGIELGQTNVSAESFKQQQQANQEAAANRLPVNNSNGILAANSIGATSATTYGARQGNGLVDIFA